MSFPKASVLLSVVLFFAALSSFAQVDTGAIVGTVADSQQQRVADATVRLTRESTGVERTTKSDRDGNFSFSPVAIGTYSVSVEHEGFDRYVQTGISISAQTSAQ